MVHVPLMFLSEWREFPSAPLPCRKKNLMTARVSVLLKSRASPDMLPFSLCNKERLAIRHMNRPFFPTTQWIPSYDIGKCWAKDLSAPPRSCDICPQLLLILADKNPFYSNISHVNLLYPWNSTTFGS